MRTILFLVGKPGENADIQNALRDWGDVQIVETVEDALGALRERRFDLVIGQTDDFLPLARLAGPLRAVTILEHIGQGVCIVARDGRIVWSNPKFESYSETILEQIRAAAAILRAEFEAEQAQAHTPRSRRRILEVGREFVLDLQASPVSGSGDRVEQVVVVVRDVTAARRAQEKLDAIDAAGRELVRLDAEALAEMDVGDRLHLLEDRIIRFMHDLMHFDHFIVRVLDKENGRLETVIAGGMSEEAKSLDLYAAADGRGISGHVAAVGRSYICPDVAKDPRYLPGVHDARSSLTVPLRLHDQIVGVLNIESHQVAAFSENDRQLAEIFGRYIAIALNILKLLVVERRATTGQIAEDVAAELAAPLNDILTEATSIMEEYIGQDDLRRRLHAIIDDVDRTKKAIKSITEVDAVRGLMPATDESDPLIDGKRILIADDEDIIRDTISEVLSKAGALTVTARDGEQAVAMIRSQHFNLVLSDIKMPHKSGYEVFSAAKQADEHCPVILITGFGYDPNHSIVRASQKGLAAVLYKPFKVDKLLDEIRSALSSHVA